VRSRVCHAVAASYAVAAAAKKDAAQAERNPKNVENGFLAFLNWNLLPPNPFQIKLASGIFRIFREIFGGIRGEGVKKS
jgi:hypothetical protein